MCRTVSRKKFGVGFGNEAPKAPRTSRRRRRGRDAERVEGGGEWGGGVPLPSRLGGLGSVVSSPSGVRGGAPAENGFGALYSCQKAPVAIILNILKCMFSLESSIINFRGRGLIPETPLKYGPVDVCGLALQYVTRGRNANISAPLSRGDHVIPFT